MNSPPLGVVDAMLLYAYDAKPRATPASPATAVALPALAAAASSAPAAAGAGSSSSATDKIEKAFYRLSLTRPKWGKILRRDYERAQGVANDEQLNMLTKMIRRAGKTAARAMTFVADVATVTTTVEEYYARWTKGLKQTEITSLKSLYGEEIDKETLRLFIGSRINAYLQDDGQTVSEMVFTCTSDDTYHIQVDITVKLERVGTFKCQLGGLEKVKKSATPVFSEENLVKRFIEQYCVWIRMLKK